MRALLVALVAVTAPLAAAQREDPSSWVLRLSTGLDVHAAGDLSAWQVAEQEALAARGVPLQATDAFPAFLTFRMEAGYAGARWNYRRFVRYEVGAEVGVSSTGGRLHYQDYSGEFAAERRVHRVLVGVYGEHEVAAVGPALVSGRLHLRVNPTTTTYGRDVRLGSEAVEDVDAAFRSLGVSALPALVVEVDASRRLRVRAHAGYEAAWGPGLTDLDGELPEGAQWSGESPRVGWSGARAGLGVALRLGGER